jgi:hypothetical protein
MNWLREYAFPTLIVLSVSLLICAGLWMIYVSIGGGAPTETPLAASQESAGEVQVSATESSELGMPGSFSLLLEGALEVALFMAVPGVITLRVLRVLQRRSSRQMAAS